MWLTAGGFCFITALALESKVALGLAIPDNSILENATIYKGAGVVIDTSF